MGDPLERLSAGIDFEILGEALTDKLQENPMAVRLIELGTRMPIENGISKGQSRKKALCLCFYV